MDKDAPKKQGKEAAPADAGPSRRHHPLLAATAFVGLLVVFIILIWDWNWFKKPIERRVSAATGRAFHINGDLSVKLAWKPRITFERITLGNLPGNPEPLMASAGLLQFRLHLRPLLTHHWEFSDVKLAQPRL